MDSVSFSFISPIISFLESSKYFLLFVGTFFGGPIVMISSGFLWHLGVFNFIPMSLTLIGSNFVGDIMWYVLGYVGARPLLAKFGKIFKIKPEIIERVEKKFEKYENRVLVFSKLTMGFGFGMGILLLAGIIKVPFKKYILLNFISGLVLILISIFIGYLFGNIYIVIPPILKIIFLVGIIILIIWGMKKIKIYLASEKI
ncbi:MAG: VTT domain-containing protein [Candidatus Paceibacterota bacterium]